MSAFDWDDLRFFLAVARAGRLTAAARQLEADHTTVSRRISALEAALKAKLFERSPQGYTLTEQGERLLGQGGGHGDPGAGGGKRARRRGPRPLRHRAHRRAGRDRHLFPRARARGARRAAPWPHPAARGLAAHLLALQARGRHRRHPGAADGRAPRVAQAHRLPPPALCLEGLSRPARAGIASCRISRAKPS